MPEVSVIVPNYNHARFLQQRLNSILEQTFQDYEVIILDDCSTDNSREIIDQYRDHPKVTEIVFNETNGGTPFLQWQKGMELAKGKWIWIAESDDYATPDFLENVLSIATREDNVGVAYAGSHWVNETGKIGKDLSSYTESFFRKGIDEIKQKLYHVCTIQNASAAIFRRDIAIHCIKGMHRFRSCGDWIFYVKMLQDANLVFTGKKLNSFRYYHANTSNWAEKNGLWITEGVYLLKHISFKKVPFSKSEFAEVIDFWKRYAQNLPDKKRRRKVHFILYQIMLKYKLGL